MGGLRAGIVAMAVTALLAAAGAADDASSAAKHGKPGAGKTAPRRAPSARARPAPALPSGISVYPSPPWTGPSLRSYTEPALPSDRRSVPGAGGPGHSRALRGTPPCPKGQPSGQEPSCGVAGEGARDALAALRRAWLAGDAARTGAYLPGGGTVTLVSHGRARPMAPAEFLRRLRSRPVAALRFDRVEAASAEHVRAAGTCTLRGVAGERLVYLLLRAEGRRWVIVAADLGE